MVYNFKLIYKVYHQSQYHIIIVLKRDVIFIINYYRSAIEDWIYYFDDSYVESSYLCKIRRSKKKKHHIHALSTHHSSIDCKKSPKTRTKPVTRYPLLLSICFRLYASCHHSPLSVFVINEFHLICFYSLKFCKDKKSDYFWASLCKHMAYTIVWSSA